MCRRSECIGEAHGEHLLELGARSEPRGNVHHDPLVIGFRPGGFLFQHHVVVVDEVRADGGSEAFVDLEFEQAGPIVSMLPGESR